VTDETTSQAKSKREVSSIGFPYLDLDDAITVARAMLDRGGVPMDRDQVAAALNQAPTSGAFAIKLSTARSFGLIESADGRFKLTELGFDILDPAREKTAKAKAFLNVPLYKKTYEEFRGRQLPPRPLGLEQAFAKFGVSPKQTDKARQAFDRSARSAGYFPTPAEDRLVQPVISLTEIADLEEPAPSQEVERVSAPTRAAVARAPSGLHPFVEGLLQTLPPVGSEWSSADRAKWLQAAAQIFDLLYLGASGPISVLVKGDD
jgi:hypothetical protein